MKATLQMLEGGSASLDALVALTFNYLYGVRQGSPIIVLAVHGRAWVLRARTLFDRLSGK